MTATIRTVQTFPSPSTTPMIELKTNKVSPGKTEKVNSLLSKLREYGYNLSPEDGISQTCGSHDILLLKETKCHQNAIHIAVKKGQIDMVKALLRLPNAKKAINGLDLHQNTPLHFAASSHLPPALPIVKLLLQHGADPMIQNQRGQNPLAVHLLTVREDNPSISQLLLSKMDLTFILNDERVGDTTYLHLAVQKNFLSIAFALIQVGMSFNIIDSSGVCVADMVNEKVLLKMIIAIRRPLAPSSIRTSCKICKTSSGAFTHIEDCAHCGRASCDSCLIKCSDAKIKLQKGSDGKRSLVCIDQELRTTATEMSGDSKICTVCSKWLQIRNLKTKQREHFMVNLFGCDGWRIKQ